MRYNVQMMFKWSECLLSINQHIAGVLKQARQQRGWSLDKTARATGVSKAMLGQIEREESSPTIATLWKIATGLQLSFTSLVADLPDPAFPTILHTSTDASTPLPQDDLRVVIIFPFDTRLGFEYMELTLPPGTEHFSDPHETGVIEHVVVIEGAMEVLLEGEWVALSERDALRFAAEKPHGYRNLSTETAVFHNVIHYPGRVD